MKSCVVHVVLSSWKHMTQSPCIENCSKWEWKLKALKGRFTKKYKLKIFYIKVRWEILKMDILKSGQSQWYGWTEVLGRTFLSFFVIWVTWPLKRYTNFFISFCYLPPSQIPDKKMDIILSTVKGETGRACQTLISLAQILVVSEKC